MKIVFTFLLIVSVFIACDKSSNDASQLSEVDNEATQNMNAELAALSTSLNNLRSATTTDERHHWDSAYHHHDSLFWLHHNSYHHETYTHDDHSHHWAQYDPAINHHDHYHHSFPGHLNDSLVTIQNNHHHNSDDNHNPGHVINHHHTLDSLHHIHNQTHP